MFRCTGDELLVQGDNFTVLIIQPCVKLRYICRYEYNIKTDRREMRWGGMDWSDLAQDRDQWWALVKSVIHIWVP
jgi:hypothetical protein